MSILSVRNLSVSVQGQRILRDITLDVADGEIIGLIGPNGSGKTTFFNALSGFLRPEKGTVRFRDADITHVSAPERARTSASSAI
jgi:ABC-type branched-subunit amino acid transport system ATPase component